MAYSGKQSPTGCRDLPASHLFAGSRRPAPATTNPIAVPGSASADFLRLKQFTNIGLSIMSDSGQTTKYPSAELIMQWECLAKNINATAALSRQATVDVAAFVARKACDWMLEQCANEFADRLQDDLEHGVKWLSEQASKDFHSACPRMSSFLGWLNAEAAIRSGDSHDRA